MRRDFSDENKEQLLAIIDKIEKEHQWAFFDWLSDIWISIKRLFIKKPADADEEAYKKYYRDILDANDYLKSQINSMFIQANNLDVVQGASAAYLGQTALQVSEKLKELVAITTEASLNAWTDANINLEEHELPDTGIIISRHPPAIDDETWITICLNQYFSPFLQFSSLTSEYLADFGLWEAFLISLFSWKDIWKAELLDTPGAAGLKNQIAEYMLNGEAGYKTIQDLAKELNISEDEAKELLLDYLDPTRHQRFDPNADLPDIYNRDLYHERDFVRYKPFIQKFLSDNVELALNDAALYEKLCVDMGLDPQIAKQIINGEVDGLSVRQYMDGIAETLKYLEKEHVLDIQMPSAAKKANQAKSLAKTLYSTLYAQDESSLSGLNLEKRMKEAGLTVTPKNALKEYWKDGQLTDAEAAEFLKKYSSVIGISSDIDPETFKKVSEMMNGLDKAGKVYKGAKKVTEVAGYIDYVFQDYEQQLALIDQLRLSAGPNADPAYIQALNRLQAEYDSTVQRAFSEGLDIAIDKGIDIAISKWPAAAAVDTAINLAGMITGASGHASAASDIIAYSQTAYEMQSCYMDAVEHVRNGNTTPEDIMRVRMTFESTRQAHIKLLSAELSYSKGYIGPWDDKKDKIAYLEYQIDALKNMQPGDDIKLLSFDEFMKL